MCGGNRIEVFTRDEVISGKLFLQMLMNLHTVLYFGVNSQIFDGTYLQAGPSVICAAFLAIGTAFFAWIKITTAPAPWTFACVSLARTDRIFTRLNCTMI